MHRTNAEVGAFLHAAEGEIVCRLINPQIPYFNAGIYLQNKSKVGKVEEILGPVNKVYFTIKPDNGVNPTSFKVDDTFYIGTDKLLPLSRFLNEGKKPGGGAGRGAGRGAGGRGGTLFQSLSFFSFSPRTTANMYTHYKSFWILYYDIQVDVVVVEVLLDVDLVEDLQVEVLQGVDLVVDPLVEADLVGEEDSRRMKHEQI